MPEKVFFNSLSVRIESAGIPAMKGRGMLFQQLVTIQICPFSDQGRAASAWWKAAKLLSLKRTNTTFFRECPFPASKKARTVCRASGAA
jgi:hypothetical protein